MSAIAWIIVIVVLLIAVPVVFSLLRQRDFRRQVEGKRPLRTLKENEPAPSGEKPALSPEMEAEKTICEMKSKSNCFTAR